MDAELIPGTVGVTKEYTLDGTWPSQSTMHTPAPSGNLENPIRSTVCYENMWGKSGSRNYHAAASPSCPV